MKTHVAIMTGCLLVLCGASAGAQVGFTDQDVPTTPGTVFEYLVEADAAVDVGAAGGNQFWDFTQVGAHSVQTEELVDPASSPFFNLFPTANKVSLGPVPFGLVDVPAWRYDEVTAGQWTLLGISLFVDEFGLDFPLPIGFPLMPLPLTYTDTWGLDLNQDVTIDVDLIPYPIPVFDEIRLEITIQGDNTCDGWGTVALPGGTVDALRVFTNVGGHADAVGIYYLFGLPVEIPLGEVFRLDVSKAYSWYSPGYGEVAFALSNPGETDPNFTTAALVRRQNLGGTPGAIVLDAQPLDPPIEIPQQGGSFAWSLGITSTFQTPFTGFIWTTATLPSGAEYFIESVPVVLPAGADIFLPSLSQAVPAGAPAGDYVFNVYAGPELNLPVSLDGFAFSKLAAGTAELGVGDWRSAGWHPLVATSAGTPVKAADGRAGSVLEAAYPNPFNPTTTLALTLQEAAPVHVVVYDALGRQAAVLARGLYGAGRHLLTFDGADLASGVYFVAATVGNQVPETRKIVLLK